MKINRIKSSLRSILAAALILILAAGSMNMAGHEVHADDGGSAIPEADKFGQVKVYSTITAGKVLKDSYYYSDGWFSVDPSVENTGLALLSMQLVAAAVDSDPDGLGGDFLTELGFDGVGFYGNPNLDERDCNYTYGIKTLEDGTRLVAVAIQSYAFDKNGKAKGWPQNFEVNGPSVGGEHHALSQAAETVLPKIVNLAGDGDVKYWITGQSRGGALAGLIASKLPQEIGERNKGIYAYTFEAPSVVEPESDAERQAFIDDFSYIHNYICSDDIVTFIPPWGMVHYGVDHIMNTAEADANLESELKKLGSDAEIPEEYDKEKSTARAEEIVDALMSRIPTRAKYSMDHTDTITLPDGTDKLITYNYQELLKKLLATVFGGALDNADIGKAADYLQEAIDYLTIYVRGYLAECGMLDGDPDPLLFYWEAAADLNPFLKDKANLDLELTDEELYVVLKLVAPAVIDKDFGEALDYDPNSDEEMPTVGYIEPALKLTDNIFSHHFDTLIARLHTLAPAPEMSDLDFDVEAPKAEDPATRMPRKVEAAVKESESGSWLSASAEWDTDDSILKNNKNYYLRVTFKAPGHAIPEDVKIRINGEDPVETEVIFKDGVSQVTAVWKYRFGEPKMLTVEFGVDDRCEAPDTIEVELGTKLKYVEKPADPVCAGYRFDEWYRLEGDPWDDIIVNVNEHVDAHWIRQVDKISIKFTVPRVGQKWKHPTVPTGSVYRIEEPEVLNEDYDEITTVKNRKALRLTFNVRLNSEDAELVTELNEDGDREFIGTLTVNGKKATVNAEEKYLRVEYEFKPLPKMPKLSKKSITVKKGKTKTVKIIGKDKSIKNTYKKTKKAKIVSKKNASTIKVKGLKKGKTTLKIKANGVWLKLKVKVK